MGPHKKLTKADMQAALPPGGKITKYHGNNTCEWVGDDGVLHLRLWRTDIMSTDPQGNITLDSGGWQTVTTKDRINRFLDGYSVYQAGGKWFVRNHETGEEAPFFDGMVLKPHEKLPRNIDREAEQALRLKQINKFCKELAKLDKLPMPSEGDCWLCSMVVKETGKTWGDGDRDHLVSHLEEMYIHGSLLVNAFRWAGWTDLRISRAFHSNDGRWAVVPTVRRYLKRKLGFAA